MHTLTVEPLMAEDLVSVAQCIAIDGEVFPYASATFGMRSGAGRVWVAREAAEPRVVGFVAGHARGRLFHVAGVAVDPPSRRCGIGRALMQTVVRYARATGLHGVELHVSVANRAAIALYRAEGF